MGEGSAGKQWDPKGRASDPAREKQGRVHPWVGCGSCSIKKKNREITGGEVKGVGEERVKMPL